MNKNPSMENAEKNLSDISKTKDFGKFKRGDYWDKQREIQNSIGNLR